MITTTQIKKNETLKELCELKDSLFSIINNIQKSFDSFNQLYSRISGEYEYSCPSLSFLLKDCLGAYSDTIAQEKFRRKLDSYFWETFINNSGILNNLNGTLESKLTNFYTANDTRYNEDEKTIPEFTTESANSLLEQLNGITPIMRRASAHDMFQKLTGSKFYKSGKWWNDAEGRSKNKIEKIFRFNHFPEWSGLYSGFGYDANFALFGDLENLCRMIDLKDHLPIEKRISAKLKDDLYRGANETVFPYKAENEYFSLTIYKRGTVNLKFLNDEVLDYLNKWGATKTELPDFA